MKVIFKLGVLSAAVLSSSSLFALDELSKQDINSALKAMKKGVLKCDLEAATQFYIGDTKFYTYKMDGARRITTEKSLDQIKQGIASICTSKNIEINSRSLQQKYIAIDDTGEWAEVTALSKSKVKFPDGNKTIKERIRYVFGLVDGELKVYQEHATVLEAKGFDPELDQVENDQEEGF